MFGIERFERVLGVVIVQQRLSGTARLQRAEFGDRSWRKGWWMKGRFVFRKGLEALRAPICVRGRRAQGVT